VSGKVAVKNVAQCQVFECDYGSVFKEIVRDFPPSLASVTRENVLLGVSGQSGENVLVLVDSV